MSDDRIMREAVQLARRVWGYFDKDMEWFDNHKTLGGPAHIIRLCLVALTAAEERGRREERERCARATKEWLRAYGLKSGNEIFAAIMGAKEAGDE